MTFDPRDHINPADTDYAELWHDDLAPLPAARFHAEMIHELRGQLADRDAEIASQKAVMNQQATIIAIATEQHDRVIARLLDGWQPELANKTDHESRTRWVRGGVGNMTRCERFQTAEMSDAEAAIIRAHQEKTT